MNNDNKINKTNSEKTYHAQITLHLFNKKPGNAQQLDSMEKLSMCHITSPYLSEAIQQLVKYIKYNDMPVINKMIAINSLLSDEGMRDFIADYFNNINDECTYENQE